jgi:hypothetical protein
MEERDYLAEKRSAIRSSAAKASKYRNKRTLLSGVITVLFLVGIVLASYDFSSEEAPTIATPAKAPAQEKTPTPAPTTAPTITTASIPAPSIKIDSPKNATYKTSTPLLSFIVAGSNLDSVLLSVDGGENITVPHDGSLAVVKEAMAYEVLNESFEDKSWLESWSEPSPAYTASIDTQSYYGEHSLRVSTKRISKGWSWIRREMSVIPGARYKIEAHIKGENVVGLHIAVDAYDNSKGKWFRLTNLGAKKGTFDWIESSERIYVPESVDRIRINLNHGWSLDGVKPAISWFDGIQVSPLTMVQEVGGKSVVLLESLQDGPHTLTIFANNSAGNSSSVTTFFTINTTTAKAGEEKIGGMGDTLTKGGFEVTLKNFEIFKEVKIYLNTPKTVYEVKTQSVVTLQVKNIEEKEKPFKLDPSAVLLDDQGRQYGMRLYRFGVSGENQIEQTTIYPGVTREGVILFDPVSLSVKNLTLYLYINNIKYEFAFSPFG